MKANESISCASPPDFNPHLIPQPIHHRASFEFSTSCSLKVSARLRCGENCFYFYRCATDSLGDKLSGLGNIFTPLTFYCVEVWIEPCDSQKKTLLSVEIKLYYLNGLVEKLILPYLSTIWTQIYAQPIFTLWLLIRSTCVQLRRFAIPKSINAK